MSNPILTVAQREYVQRITSKGFLIGTLIAPLGFALMLFLPVLIATMSKDSTTRLAVVDSTGVVMPKLTSTDALAFTDATALPVDSLRAQVERKALDGYLVLPAQLLDGKGEATYYGRGGGGFALSGGIARAVTGAVREVRFERAGVGQDVREIAGSEVEVRSRKLSAAGGKDEADAPEVLAALGYGVGLLIYVLMLIYGAMVLQGVIEEKQSRIVEVIISSVRPIELMLGKVLGIGAVGLTQFAVWMIASFALLTVAGPLLANMAPHGAAAGGAAMPGGFELPHIPGSIFIFAPLYFIFGFFMYAMLYAAIGSAVDELSDAQALQLPIILPIIMTMMFIMQVLKDPNGGLATVLSLVPLFSPILMTVRIAATTVPAWQIALSFILMGATIYGLAWLAGRIYRVGILMSGKKPSYADLIRWARQAG